MRRTLIAIAATAVLTAAFGGTASAQTTPFTVSSFTSAPPFLGADGWGQPEWNTPDQSATEETGCLTKTASPGRLAVSGWFGPVAGVSYTLQREAAGSDVWHDLGPVVPGPGGKFHVKWWIENTGQPCPKVDQTFQVVGEDTDGNQYTSNTIQLGVFPPFKGLLFDRVYSKGKLLRWKLTTSTDETSVHVSTHRCEKFDPDKTRTVCDLTKPHQFHSLETLRFGVMGHTTFTYTVGCYPRIFKFVFPATTLHSPMVSERVLFTPLKQPGC